MGGLSHVRIFPYQVFSYDGHKIKFVACEGELWFCKADIERAVDCHMTPPIDGKRLRRVYTSHCYILTDPKEHKVNYYEVINIYRLIELLNESRVPKSKRMYVRQFVSWAVQKAEKIERGWKATQANNEGFEGTR